MKRSLFFAIGAAVFLHTVVTAQVPGRSTNMVSGTTLPDGDPFLQRQNEPSGGVSTRNPLHLLAGANDYRTVDIPGLPDGAEVGDAWLSVFKSYDGGQSWRSTLIPGYPQDTSAAGRASPLKGYQAAADPTVRPGTNGLFYYSGIAFDRGTNARNSLFISRFIDNNNAPGGDPIVFLDTKLVEKGRRGTFIDKPYMAVDIPRRGAGTCSIQAPGTNTVQKIPAGTVYIAYLLFNNDPVAPTSKLMATRSLDCGKTWSRPSKVSEKKHTNQGVSMAIDPVTGALYLAWREFADKKTDHSILVAKSIDLGRGKKDRDGDWDDDRVPEPLKFTDPATLAVIKPFDQGTSETSFRTNSYPSIAVDGTGRVYVAWAERGWGPVDPAAPTQTPGMPAPGDARIVMSVGGPFGVNRRAIDDDDDRPNMRWSEPRPIEPHLNPGHQIMPVVTAFGGKMSVVYYDLREDVSQVFKTYVDEANIYAKTPSRRHTLDLRILQANPGATPAFAPSVRVSEYMWGILPDNNGPGKLEQLTFNVPNLPLYAQGSAPFIGDFIDLAGEMFTRDATGRWTFNTNGSRTVHAFWTDNRDVRPPLNGDWKNYTPPNSEFTAKVCSPGQTGMRNSNIYTARITPGLLAGAPSNSKRLLPGTKAEDRRSFVVFAQNNSDVNRRYRFTIMGQPPGGTASFLQFSPMNDPLTMLETTIAPRSTSSRTVYMSSSDPNASVKVDISEVQDTAAGSATSLGLKASVTLNPDPTNPTVTNPTVTNAEVFNPTVTNPTVTNPTVTNPTVTNVGALNPTVTNPTVTNPTVTNVVVGNPTVTNPTVTNPTVTNPTVTNADMVNPTVTNADLVNGSLTDTTWTVKNTGNTAGSFSVKTLLTKPAPPGFKTQLLVYKTYTTPVPTPNDCTVKTESQMVLVTSIPNPTVTNPTVTNPTVTNDVINHEVTNASLWLDAGEEAKVTFRVLNPDKTQTVAEVVTRPNGQQETVYVSPAFNVEQVVAPVVTPTSVNTADAAAGVTAPVVVAPMVITTTALNDGIFAAGYSTPLASVGGVAGSHTWSISGGALPPGLQLSAAGVISGTPAAAGLFLFEVQAADSASPAHVAHADLFIRIAPLAAAQTLTAVEDQSRSIALSAVVGSYSGPIGFTTTNPLHGTLSGTAPNLTYTPTLNYHGSDSFTFTTSALTTGGAITSAAATVSLTVTAVNDAPSFTKGADQTGLEDSGARTVPGWATGMSAGPPDEQATQALSFAATNSNNSLFTVQPALAPNGTLTFTPAPDANGTAIVTVTVGDNGLTANGGVDTSAAQTFTVTVTSVNDAPSFTAGGDQTLPEDSGPQTVPAWATSISAGPPDEAGLQTLSFATSNTNPALFSVQPAIAPGGTLTFTPVPDARGTATVTVTLTDSGGGVDTSAAQEFLITVIFEGAPVVTTASLPDATRNAAYSHTLTADGMTGARTWALATNDSLPSGLLLNSATGTISGTPPTCGAFPFTVQVTDSATPTPQTAGKALILAVTGPPSITTSSLAMAVTFENGSQDLAATCGEGPRTWTIDSGSLPLGLTLTPGGTLSGVPRGNGNFAFTARVTDSGGSDTKALTLPVSGVDQRLQSGSNLITTISGATRIGQSLSAGARGTLAAVRFPTLTCSSNPLTITIEGVHPATGAPDDSMVLATTTATIAGLNQLIRLPSPIALGIDERFAVVLSSTGTCQIANSATADLYSGGGAYQDTGTGWSTTNVADLPLDTLIQNGSLLYQKVPRTTVSSVLLGDGRVLNIGTGATADVFNPATGTAIAVTMNASRINPTATLLADGRVLVVGGGFQVTTAEIFDPSNNTFTTTAGSMAQGRVQHGAALLADGRVLVLGGIGTVGASTSTLSSTEIFDPATGLFSPAGSMANARDFLRATRLDCPTATPCAWGGRILVTGRVGLGNPGVNTELYNPATNAFQATGQMSTSRLQHTATLLADGTVLVAGGQTNGAEIYSPASGTFANAGPMVSLRVRHAATLLPDGSVLLTGGGRSPGGFSANPQGAPWATAERYLPGAGFVGAPSMLVTRYDHGAVLLADGRLVIAGGYTGPGGSQQAGQTIEAYQPPNSTSPDQGQPAVAQPNLPDGFVGAPYPATTLTGTGGATPYSFAIASGALPPGLSLAGALISGTPTAPGTYLFGVRVTDSAGHIGTQTLRIRISPLVITTASLPGGYLGRAYSQTLTATGVGAKTWSLTFGSLPAGLTLGADGTIAGTPTASAFTFTVRAVDSAGQSATASLFIAVNNPLDITTTSLREFVVLDQIFTCVNTQNGFGNKAFTIQAGALPPGLSLSSSGCLTGVAARTGSFTFMVAVSDESTPPQTDTQALSIHVSVQDQGNGSELTPAFTFGPSGTSGPRGLAQTMTAGVTGSLWAVSLWNLGCPGNTQLTVQVQSVTPTRGLPSGTVLASGTGIWYEPVVMAVPPTLTAGQRVALVFSAGNDCTVTNATSFDYYTRGEGFLRAGTGPWETLVDAEDRSDLPFRSLMVPSTDFHYLTARRAAHTSTLLLTGKILTAGGYSGGTAELFNPADGLSTPTGSMSTGRIGHTATLLNNGKVLIVGGVEFATGVYLATAEVYDPSTGTFSPTANSLSSGRIRHAAARLDDGRVLIAGGYGQNGGDRSTEIYDPTANSFTPAGNMTSSRYDFTATLLSNNKVLLFGGNTWGPFPVADSEVFDPASGIFVPVPGPYRPLRAHHTATTLNDGRVAIIGGVKWPNMAAAIDIYNPLTDTLSESVSLLTPRHNHTAAALSDGTILVAGGLPGIDWSDDPLASVERLSLTGTFSPAGSLGIRRYDHTMVSLGATVLVIGGQSPSDVSAVSAELFDPSVGIVITPATLPDGSSTPPGNSYSATIAATGGSGPLTLTLVSGSLPPGLSFDGGTGVISGTPTTTGNFVFGIRASDGAHTAVQTFQIRIDAHAITTSTLPDGHQGVAYSYPLVATGQSPMSWSMGNYGGLPPGLSLSGAGVLSGTPTTAGQFNFKVQATDFTGRTATRILWLNVTNALQITTTALDDAVAPWFHNGCVAWTGGAGTISFATSSGELPHGLTLSSNGCFNSTPRQTGKFTFTVQATDQSTPPQVASRTFSLRVGTVDQANHSIDVPTAPPAATFGNGVGLAQVFTPRMNGYLLGFQMPVACTFGDVHVEIRGVTGGQPNATVLGTADIAAAAVGPFTGTPFFRRLPFSTPVFLTSGVQVAAVLETAGSCAVSRTQATTEFQNNAYADGDAFTGSTGAWTALSLSDPVRPDVPFQAIVDEGGRLEFMINPRNEHTETLLTAGDYAGLVLLTGGWGAPAATEFFNPTASEIAGIPPGQFGAGPTMNVGRVHHTATQLADGSVIVIGGFDSNQNALASAERFNPVTHVWTAIGSMSTTRFAHTSTLLSNDTLLIVGGYEYDWYSSPLATTQQLLHDGPYVFLSGPPLTTGRAGHAAVKLNDGRVLVTGGWGVSAAAAGELYTLGSGFTAAGPMQFARAQHSATLLGNGKVLLAGGSTGSGPVSEAEVFYPYEDSFTAVGTTEPRKRARAVLLDNGKVLIVAGTDHAGVALPSTAVYDPSTQTFTPGGDLTVGRGGVTATHVVGDRVLIAGGCCTSNAQHVSAEIFDPAIQTIPAGTVGTAFSATIAGFGTAPHSFSVKSGTPPPGLSLNAASGTISGTPAGAGTYWLVVEVVDSSTPARRILREVTIQIGSPSETWTATAGGDGGAAFGPFYCPAGSAATALKGRASGDIDRTELWCSPFVPNGFGPATFVNGASELSGGTPYDFSCPAGMALTGVLGKAGNVPGVGVVVDTMGATCRNLGSGSTHQFPPVGNDSGMAPFALNCPTGQAVVGIVGRQGWVLDQIQLICR